jgi:AcrR family transcriptional regulator
MAKARPRGRDEVVEALLASARKLIAERGPSVALRDIADDAGVNFGLLYHYLGTKEQVVDEVYRHAARQAAERLGGVHQTREVLQLLSTFGDGTTARLVGWAVLEGRGSADGFRDSPALDLLARRLIADSATAGPPIADEDARVFAAFVMAILLGWRLFAPTALLAAGLPATSPDEYSSHVVTYLEQLAAAVTGVAAPDKTP